MAHTVSGVFHPFLKVLIFRVNSSEASAYEYPYQSSEILINVKVKGKTEVQTKLGQVRRRKPSTLSI